MAKFDITNVVHKPDIRGTISLIGRAMITLGLILLLFVGYQLWGTNVFERLNQDNLRNEFAQKVNLDGVELDEDGNPIEDPTMGGNGQSDPDGDGGVIGDQPQLTEDVVRGEPIAQIIIPKIGLDRIVVSGTDKVSLQKGPGHYPNTPLPGQFGNSAIAGHRTTYGAPFARQDELEVGDRITLVTARGTFIYEVNAPNIIVRPDQVDVINPTLDPADPTGQTYLATLTLTTCHPRYSAAQRMVTTATLVGGTATEPTQLLVNGELPSVIDLGNDDSFDLEGFGNDNILVAMMKASLELPLLWWLLLFITVGSIWWYFYRRFHNWKVWVIGAIPFVVVMLIYFVNLEKALPTI